MTGEINVKDLPLVSLKIYNPEITLEEVIGFNAYDRETQDKIVKMLKMAKYKMEFRDAVTYGYPVLFKVSNVNVNIYTGDVMLTLPCGYTVVVQNPDEQLYNDLKLCRNEIVYVELTPEVVKTKKKAFIRAKEVKTYIGSVDLETAKSLLKSYDGITLLTMAFGWRVYDKALGIITPRIIGLFQPFNRPIHVIQYNPPDTGKSTFGNLAERIAPCYFFTEVPSIAKLVGDARYNSYGVAYYYKTIIFDEFDKIGSLDRQRLEQLWQVLQTGMEQGKWKRSVSSKTDISYENHCSIIFFANVRDEDLSDVGVSLTNNHKDRIKSFIKEKYRLNTEQFISRIVYAEYITKAPTTAELLNVQNGEVVYLDPKVSRGVYKIIHERTFEHPVKVVTDKKGRLPDKLNALSTVLTHLGLILPENVIYALHDGILTFTDVFVQKLHEKENVEIPTKETKDKEEEEPTEEETEENTETETIMEELKEEIEEVSWDLKDLFS